jgi:glycosyltransferase involved in cell wall biosynthesis
MDVFMNPYAEEIVTEEMNLHRWARGPVPTFVGNAAWLRTLFGFADLLLCPSKAVASAVAMMSPQDSHKIRLVPYASSCSCYPTDIPRDPATVLFAGGNYLIKGLIYLAEAAATVRRAVPNVSFRIAGLTANQVPDTMPHKDQLTFLGRLSLSQMQKEYQSATVFALPSLGDGQAGVVLEAMTLGVPVVATTEAGVDFTDGVHGRVVARRNAQALATALVELLVDPILRQRLAKNGQSLAMTEFSMENWGTRLTTIITEANSSPIQSTDSPV